MIVKKGFVRSTFKPQCHDIMEFFIIMYTKDEKDAEMLGIENESNISQESNKFYTQ